MDPVDYVLQSILTPDAYRATGFGAMPKNLVSDLSDNQIRSLLAYVVGDQYLGPIAGLTLPAREKAEPPVEITRAEAELGERVFREKGACVACHSYYQTPEYHALAPNLFQAGFRDIQYIRRAIKEPSDSVPDAYKTMVVQLVDGRVLCGQPVALNEPSRISMLVMDSHGGLASVCIDKADVEQEDGRLLVELKNKSIMPADYGSRLTNEEIDAVAKMILALNE
jgi:hypothetical protein